MRVVVRVIAPRLPDVLAASVRKPVAISLQRDLIPLRGFRARRSFASRSRLYSGASVAITGVLETGADRHNLLMMLRLITAFSRLEQMSLLRVSITQVGADRLMIRAVHSAVLSAAVITGIIFTGPGLAGTEQSPAVML